MKAGKTLVHKSCAYSFNDLFLAAHSRSASDDERKQFACLSQDERNKVVRGWADLANWLTEDRIGGDGVIYTAFWPGNDKI